MFSACLQSFNCLHVCSWCAVSFNPNSMFCHRDWHPISDYEIFMTSRLTRTTNPDAIMTHIHTRTHARQTSMRKYFLTFLVIKLHIHHLSVCVSVCLCLSILFCSFWKLYPPYLCGRGKGVLRTHVECILATRLCKSPPSLWEAEDESEEEQVYFFTVSFFFCLAKTKCLISAVRGLHHTAGSVVTLT